MANPIRPEDLPPVPALAANDAFIVDTGAGVYKTTPNEILEAADGVTSAALAASAGSSGVGFLQSGTGALSRTVQDKLRERVTPFDYGAVGDGVADDTDAFNKAITALRSGGTLDLTNGYTFLLSESLVFEKPIRIVGGAMEQNKLLFAAGGDYVDIGDGTFAAIVVMHSQTVLPGYSGDARRTCFEGVTVSAEVGLAGTVRGIVVCAPSYFYEVRVENFTSDGFAVMAGAGSPIDGIANGTVFTNCIAQYNTGHGFLFIGSDANACLINRCHGADNDAWGFYDDSLLGNTYIGCEADSNATGGYFAVSGSPNASSYLGCYSETPTYFSVGPLSQLWGAQGLYKPTRASGGIVFRGLPAGAAYCTQPIRIAATDDIAESGGDAPNAGAYIAVGDGGLDYRASATALHVKLNALLSSNYTTFFNGADAVASFPNSAFTANINPKRFHLHDGFTLGGSGKSGIVGAGTAAPVAGTYDQGAIWLNDAPAAAGKLGWVCVTAGTPGTWKAFGAIDA